MMKQIYLSILLALAMIAQAAPAKAQDEDLDKLQFEQTPYKEETPPYFGVGGGATGSFLFLNFDDVNGMLKTNGFNVGNLSTPIFMLGAEGFVVSFIVPNLRVGYLWKGGHAIAENTNVPTGIPATPTMTRTFEYRASLTGFAFDYAFMPARSIAILPGANIGWGNITMESYQGTDKSWTDLKPEVMGPNYLHRLEAGYLYLEPHVNFEFALTSFFMVRLSGGYSYSLISNSAWTVDRNAAIKDVPKGVNNNGFTASIGAFVGLFNY